MEDAEVESRLVKFGKNDYSPQASIPYLKIISEQILNPLILILLAITILNFCFGKFIDGTVILIIVIINTLIGVYQELKSRIEVLSLAKITPEFAQVIRSGSRQKISAQTIVPGDIIYLEQGDKVPADARIIELHDLKVDESILTGESIPVAKILKTYPQDTSLAERKNMVFAGTFVIYGRAKAVVIATGLNSEFGKIAKTIETEDAPETTLQKQIKQFSTWIIKIVFGFSIIIVLISLLRQFSFIDSITIATALAVSAIPEGLPALITITLAMGVYQIAKKNAIMQDLEAVETLGQISCIATDKTGTLTQNQMSAVEVLINFKKYSLTGKGYDPNGFLADPETNKKIELDKISTDFFSAIGLCNDADLIKDKNSQNRDFWRINGDPTDGALLVGTIKTGLNINKLKTQYPRLDEIPFSTRQKFMAVLVKRKNDHFLIVKGAPEVILQRSSRTFPSAQFFSKVGKEKIKKQNQEFAQIGYRVLAVAVKKLDATHDKILGQDLKNLHFFGLVAIEDPPRSSAKEALKIANNAGIRVIMITGDNPHTAQAIARQVNFANPENVFTGLEIEKINGSDLTKAIKQSDVYARINPLQKLQIVRNLQKQGYIVASTGDGINDAPAIKSANIGISMGQSGTAVTREVSDMVILDDNFATIITAINQGRSIYQNIQRVIFYLLSTNFGEVLIIGTSLFVGLPLPLTAIQILWINLVTDTICTVPLAQEPAHENLMTIPPRSPKEGLISNLLKIRILVVGLTMLVVTLPVFYLISQKDIILARSIAFAIMAILQIFNVFNARTFHRSIIKLKFWANPWSIYSSLIAIFITYLTINTTFFNHIFQTKPLSFSQWLLSFSLGLVIIVTVEIEKFIRAKYYNQGVIKNE